MDYLPILLLLLAGGLGALALAGYAVGRWVERQGTRSTELASRAARLEARVRMLAAQMEDLKGLLASGDYAALRAVREFQRVEQETRRSAAILKLRDE